MNRKEELDLKIKEIEEEIFNIAFDFEDVVKCIRITITYKE